MLLQGRFRLRSKSEKTVCGGNSPTFWRGGIELAKLARLRRGKNRAPRDRGVRDRLRQRCGAAHRSRRRGVGRARLEGRVCDGAGGGKEVCKVSCTAWIRRDTAKRGSVLPHQDKTALCVASRRIALRIPAARKPGVYDPCIPARCSHTKMPRQWRNLFETLSSTETSRFRPPRA
jgi:hypothetical protein